MAQASIDASGVLDAALEMIVRVDHIQAVLVDQFLDSMINKKTFWLKKPRFQSREQILKAYSNDLELQSAYMVHRSQRDRCEAMANLARTALQMGQKEVIISDEDLSSLGVNGFDGLKKTFKFHKDSTSPK